MEIPVEGPRSKEKQEMRPSPCVSFTIIALMDSIKYEVEKLSFNNPRRK